jgi:hypothetical protein
MQPRTGPEIGGSLKIFARSKWFLLAMLLVGFVLSSCSSFTSVASHEWLEAPDWARARLMDVTESRAQIIPAIDDSGNSYFAFIQTNENGPQVVVKKLDASLQLLWERLIDLGNIYRASTPRIILSNNGVEIFWLVNGGLYSEQLSLEGEQLSAAKRISGSRIVGHYDVAVTNENERILWFSGDRNDPGLFNADPAGNIEVVDFDGYQPQIVIGQDNTMYVVWLQLDSGLEDYTVFLGQYPDAEFVEDHVQQIYNIALPISSALEGPEIAIDEDSLYFFWSEETRSGPSAGQIESNYFSLPFDRVQLLRERDFGFPNRFSLNYVDTDSYFEVGRRAVPQLQRAFVASSLQNLTAIQSQNSETVVTFSADLPYLLNNNANQVGLIFLEEGRVSAYQLLSFTAGNSEYPSIQTDANGYLYLTWLERDDNNDYRVYFSTTRPETKAVLDELTNEDVARFSGNSLFGILSGLVLIPFPLFWSLGPMVLFFLLGFLRKENEPITGIGTLVTILLSLIVYTYAKLSTLTGMLDYTPFSAWIPIIPESWFDPLRISMPILIGLIGLLVAYWRTYARANRSPLFFLAFFIVVDGLLTIAIYGSLFFGAA